MFLEKCHSCFIIGLKQEWFSIFQINPIFINSALMYIQEQIIIPTGNRNVNDEKTHKKRKESQKYPT